MFKRVFCLVLITVIILNCCGCWDARDVGDLAFPIAAAYDVHDNNIDLGIQCERGEKCQIDATTIDPTLSPNTKAKVRVETLPAATIAIARNKRGLTNADDYLPGLNQSIIFGEELAKRGLTAYTDSILRVPSIPIYMLLVVAEGRGQTILETPIPHHENLGLYLQQLLKESQTKGFVPSTTLYKYYVDQAPGKNPVMPLIRRSGKDDVVLDGAAVFKKDKMLKKLGRKDTRILVMLRGLKSQGYVPYKLEKDGQLLDEGTVFLKNSRKVKVIRQQDNYIFNINIKLGGVLVESTKGKKIDEEYLKQIENAISRDIAGQGRQFIAQMQNEMKIDCIDINKYALAKWRRELQTSIDSDFIENASIKVKVEVHLENTGELI